MRAYKIVKNVNGKLFSWNFEGWGTVQYIPGKWVEAPELAQKYGYHLTVFEIFEDAEAWVIRAESSSLEIWECEIILAKRIMPPIYWAIGSSSLVEFAKENNKSKQYFYGNSPEQLDWPKGTLMAKKVKLIRKVWPKDKEVCDD